MEADLRIIEPRLASAGDQHADHIRAMFAEARAHLDAAATLWRQHVEEYSRSASSTWRDTRRKARVHIREARRRWSAARSQATAIM
jgi:hypothetical protein